MKDRKVCNEQVIMIKKLRFLHNAMKAFRASRPSLFEGIGPWSIKAFSGNFDVAALDADLGGFPPLRLWFGVGCLCGHIGGWGDRPGGKSFRVVCACAISPDA